MLSPSTKTKPQVLDTLGEEELTAEDEVVRYSDKLGIGGKHLSQALKDVQKGKGYTAPSEVEPEKLVGMEMRAKGESLVGGHRLELWPSLVNMLVYEGLSRREVARRLDTNGKLINAIVDSPKFQMVLESHIERKMAVSSRVAIADAETRLQRLENLYHVADRDGEFGDALKCLQAAREETKVAQDWATRKEEGAKKGAGDIVVNVGLLQPQAEPEATEVEVSVEAR